MFRTEQVKKRQQINEERSDREVEINFGRCSLISIKNKDVFQIPHDLTSMLNLKNRINEKLIRKSQRYREKNGGLLDGGAEWR